MFSVLYNVYFFILNNPLELTSTLPLPFKAKNVNYWCRVEMHALITLGIHSQMYCLGGHFLCDDYSDQDSESRQSKVKLELESPDLQCMLQLSHAGFCSMKQLQLLFV